MARDYRFLRNRLTLALVLGQGPDGNRTDELFAEWNAAQATIVPNPEDKPWKLREFVVADIDSNLLRVFYDFRHDVAETHI